MLNLRTPLDLAKLLRTSVPKLCGILRRADDFYEELLLVDPRRPAKHRLVINARGALRRLQSQFYADALLPKLSRSPFSHGGVIGRNIKTNALPHIGQSFVFTTDIADFYPSISWERLIRLFLEAGCSSQVAAMCTRLCTYRHALAQGLVTSPILADQLMRPVDERIAGACRQLGLVYTRFVDDLTISAPFDLFSSGVPAIVRRALRQNGFRVNRAKERFSAVSNGAAITQLRFSRGRPDVRKEYVAEVERQLADAARLGKGEQFTGPYYTESQIRGRVQFICWINPRRRRRFKALLGRVDWVRLRAEAQLRGLEVMTKQLVRRGRYALNVSGSLSAPNGPSSTPIETSDVSRG